MATEPYSISAGLDYPGVGPMHANLFTTEERNSSPLPMSKRCNGVSNYLKWKANSLIESACLCRSRRNEIQTEDIVVINPSGRGDKDLNTYIDYFKL
jgi:tryptophan synthase beta chain